MSEKSYDPDSNEMKELLKVNIVDEMSEVLKAIDGKLTPEIMEKLDWAIRAIQVRLSIAEGNLEILHSSHLGHTNYAPAEFKQMHGFVPGTARKSGSVSPEAKDIAKMMRLVVELRDLIIEVWEWEIEDGRYAMEAAIEILANAAGMEVVIRG